MIDIRIIRNGTLLYTAEIAFVPRIGEQIYIPYSDEANTDEYHLKVVDIEWMAFPTDTNPDTNGTPTGHLNRCNLFVEDAS